MAIEQVNQNGFLTNAPSIPSINKVTTSLQTGVNAVSSSLSSSLDRVLPSERRERLKNRTLRFAEERPLLASFLFSQIALSGLPLLSFFIMTMTILIFSLVTGIIIGVIGALMFVVFCLCVALFFLVPTLFFTTSVALFVWVWGLAAYFVVKKYNQKAVPAINTSFKEGTVDMAEIYQMAVLNGYKQESDYANEGPSSLPSNEIVNTQNETKQTQQQSEVQSDEDITTNSYDILPLHDGTDVLYGLGPHTHHRPQKLEPQSDHKQHQINGHTAQISGDSQVDETVNSAVGS